MPKQSKRKLKTYQTSLGFYDQAVAAPSMKAALEAWGAKSNLFHQGIARETDDPDIVAATMASPGVVLRRPVGTDGAFTENAELPTDLTGGEIRRKPKHKLKRTTKPGKRPAKIAAKPSRKLDDQAARKAAAAFEKEEQRRQAERRKEEAARAKARARRDKAVAAAQAALDKARREHEARAERLEAERAALDERTEAEQGRWDKQRMKLEQAMRRARE
ncbi:cell envelope biogenesis protein TolA [Bradyrhizobium xenonodulans]|uniref:Cell envelope biogenesis protein TolA n=1 Tax=Bradyrhizobium xenonodulans TaxID=2736875 RepID=A0ABY7MYS0_9BRAD|nr:cell envelope biogenesis protein TolA [Bradyrhizobium xenonodulans]WBL82120.1 cell envelope biogenesis protein TolA [Bradyrhizobium xenonodulans]